MDENIDTFGMAMLGGRFESFGSFIARIGTLGKEARNACEVASLGAAFERLGEVVVVGAAMAKGKKNGKDDLIATAKPRSCEKLGCLTLWTKRDATGRQKSHRREGLWTAALLSETWASKPCCSMMDRKRD